jgi:hypothetical protein
MPRKPKHPREMTTDEAMRHLFGRKGAAHAKRAAHEVPERGSVQRPKPQVTSTKDKDTG